jgi:hypothetical protein
MEKCLRGVLSRRCFDWLFLAASCLSCSGSDGPAQGGGASTAPLSTLCGPDYNLLGQRACPEALCRAGTVSGDAADGAYGMRFSSDDGICTKRCSTTTDCQGISFAATNGLTVASETWSCATVGSEQLCAVAVTAPPGGSDPCAICGGAICSGDCIGCPQCS